MKEFGRGYIYNFIYFHWSPVSCPVQSKAIGGSHS